MKLNNLFHSIYFLHYNAKSFLFQYICIVIANKADKLAPTKVANAVKDLQNSLNPLKDLTFLPFSAEKKTYCEDVWKEIEKHIL